MCRIIVLCVLICKISSLPQGNRFDLTNENIIDLKVETINSEDNLKDVNDTIAANKSNDLSEESSYADSTKEFSANNETIPSDKVTIILAKTLEIETTTSSSTELVTNFGTEETFKLEDIIIPKDTGNEKQVVDVVGTSESNLGTEESFKLEDIKIPKDTRNEKQVVEVAGTSESNLGTEETFKLEDIIISKDIVNEKQVVDVAGTSESNLGTEDCFKLEDVVIPKDTTTEQQVVELAGTSESKLGTEESFKLEDVIIPKDTTDEKLVDEVTSESNLGTEETFKLEDVIIPKDTTNEKRVVEVAGTPESNLGTEKSFKLEDVIIPNDTTNEKAVVEVPFESNLGTEESIKLEDIISPKDAGNDKRGVEVSGASESNFARNGINDLIENLNDVNPNFSPKLKQPDIEIISIFKPTISGSSNLHETSNAESTESSVNVENDKEKLKSESDGTSNLQTNFNSTNFSEDVGLEMLAGANQAVPLSNLQSQEIPGNHTDDETPVDLISRFRDELDKEPVSDNAEPIQNEYELGEYVIDEQFDSKTKNEEQTTDHHCSLFKQHEETAHVKSLEGSVSVRGGENIDKLQENSVESTGEEDKGNDNVSLLPAVLSESFTLSPLLFTRRFSLGFYNFGPTLKPIHNPISVNSDSPSAVLIPSKNEGGFNARDFNTEFRPINPPSNTQYLIDLKKLQKPEISYVDPYTGEAVNRINFSDSFPGFKSPNLQLYPFYHFA